MSRDDSIAVWLEFHDLDISGVLWEGMTLRIEFRFGTVYNEEHSHYGYRTGVITFTNAMTNGSFPDGDDEPWLWTGEIKIGAETFAMIPVARVSCPTIGIETRLTNADGSVVEIHAQSVSVSLTGEYQAGRGSIERPAWYAINR